MPASTDGIHDRSDRSTDWYLASDDDEVADYIDSGSEPWDEEPTGNRHWTLCDDPQREDDDDEGSKEHRHQ